MKIAPPNTPRWKPGDVVQVEVTEKLLYRFGIVLEESDILPSGELDEDALVTAILNDGSALDVGEASVEDRYFSFE